jgi:hypothetical protein
MQGNSACYQVVAHKNLDHFNRRVFVGRSSLSSPRAQDKDAPRNRYVAADGVGGAE